MKIQSRPPQKSIIPGAEEIVGYIMNAIAFEPPTCVGPAARGVVRTMVAMGYIVNSEIIVMPSSREMVVYFQFIGDSDFSRCEVITY